MNADVIVVGLGIMGTAACHELARAGLKVIGLEAFEPAHKNGSSHGESRVIRKSYAEHTGYVPLLERAYLLWRELEAEAGAQLYFESGLAYFGDRSSPLLKGVLQSAELHRLSVSEPAKELSRYFKIDQFEAGLYEKEAGYLRADFCWQALASQAREHGVELLYSHRLMSWSASPAGVEVKTDRGTFSADQVVFASGSWMKKLVPELPLRAVRKALFWVEAPKAFIQAPCYLFDLGAKVYYGFPSLDGNTIKIAEHSGGTELSDPSSVDRRRDPAEEERVHSFIDRALTGVSKKIAHHETCIYTKTPDEHFILDLHPQHPNVVLASCCSGHGFKFAPAIGEAVRELIESGSTRLPTDFLKLKRFSSKG